MTDLALPEDYATVLAGLKQRVREARFRAQRQVNTELIRLNWQIGQVLAERTDHARWGDKSLQRLSADLRSEFPGSRGFSPRNLLYLRPFARAWPGGDAIAQHPVAQLPWGHITVLLDKVPDAAQRDWYAAQAVTNGWTRASLEHHIKTQAHERFGTAPTNFDRLFESGASASRSRSRRTRTSLTSWTWSPGTLRRLQRDLGSIQRPQSSEDEKARAGCRRRP